MGSVIPFSEPSRWMSNSLDFESRSLFAILSLWSSKLPEGCVLHLTPHRIRWLQRNEEHLPDVDTSGRGKPLNSGIWSRNQHHWIGWLSNERSVYTCVVRSEEGGTPLPPRTLLSSTRKWLAQETHLLTKPETFGGRSAQVESFRGRKSRRTALPCGSRSQILWWWVSPRILWSVTVTQSPSCWYMHHLAKVDSGEKDSGRLVRHMESPLSSWPLLNSSSWW